MRKLVERLQDIHEAIVRIEKYTRLGRTSFDQNELIQVWVIHHIVILGEVASAIRKEYPDYLASHPKIPWGEISGTSKLLIHEYFRIDLNSVWAFVERDLPHIKSSLEAIMGEGW